MNNEYILITGASSGIGYEIAKIYAKQSKNLILVARRKEKLEELQKEYNNIEILNYDLSNLTSAEEIYNYTKSKGYYVSMLINNAGVGVYGDFSETNLKDEISMINLNIQNLVILTKLYLKDMLKHNNGHIVNVSSVASYTPGPKMSVYYASKAFVSSFSKSINYEIRNSKVRVSLLTPGPTNTEFVKSAKLESSKIADKFSMYSPEMVAKELVDNIDKKEVIPGILNKLLVYLVKFTPESLLLYFVNKLQERKENK